MNWKHRIAPMLLAVTLTHVTTLAQASTITVTANAPDELTADGICSLREALDNINHGDIVHDDCIAAVGAMYGDNDTIVLPAGTYTMAIVGKGEDDNATGDYDINIHVNIVGAGASVTTIDGANLSRVFHVTGPYTVSISGLTITGGSDTGGGIYNGGGTVTVTDSAITGNTSTFFGGGVRNESGVFNLVSSTLSSNTAVGGGGVLNAEGAVLNITNSTLSANQTSSYAGGGAISTRGTATVTRSTISGNSSENTGGGVFNDGTLTLTNTTFSGNTAGAEGGALYNGRGDGSDTTTATVTHGTFAGNSAGTAADSVYVNDGTVTLSNTLSVSPDGLAGECGVSDGIIVSAGHNLDTDGTCFGASGIDPVSITANLGELADNGGLTHTHALLAGSPAIDAGDCAGSVVTTDQRGESRPQGAACDIGAYELVVDSGDSGTTGNISGGGGGGGLGAWMVALLILATIIANLRATPLERDNIEKTRRCTTK